MKHFLWGFIATLIALILMDSENEPETKAMTIRSGATA